MTKQPLGIAGLLLAGLCLILASAGCSGDDDGDGGGSPASGAFNNLFSGNGTLTRGAMQDNFDMLVLLSVNSPLCGSFSVVGEDGSGTITGDASGNSSTFNATIEGICTGSFSGTMDLIGGELMVSASGQDCDGPFDLTADLDPLDLSDSYDLTTTLFGDDQCDLGAGFGLPTTIDQSGDSAEILHGVIPGPGVSCGGSDASVRLGFSSPLVSASLFDTTVVYTDFFGPGCSLTSKELWSLVVTEGTVENTSQWHVRLDDSPSGCADFGPNLPCENTYFITGSECAACGPACSGIGTPVNGLTQGAGWLHGR